MEKCKRKIILKFRCCKFLSIYYFILQWTELLYFFFAQRWVGPSAGAVLECPLDRLLSSLFHHVNQHYDIIIQLAFRLFFCCRSTIWNYSSTQPHSSHRMNVKWNQSRDGDVDQPTNDDSEFWSDLIFFSVSRVAFLWWFLISSSQVVCTLNSSLEARKEGKASKSREISCYKTCKYWWSRLCKHFSKHSSQGSKQKENSKLPAHWNSRWSSTIVKEKKNVATTHAFNL